METCEHPNRIAAWESSAESRSKSPFILTAKILVSAYDRTDRNVMETEAQIRTTFFCSSLRADESATSTFRGCRRYLSKPPSKRLGAGTVDDRIIYTVLSTWVSLLVRTESTNDANGAICRTCESCHALSILHVR
jgi:hypothetical protein